MLESSKPDDDPILLTDSLEAFRDFTDVLFRLAFVPILYAMLGLIVPL